MNPLTRRSNVIVQQVGSDLVVYDELRDRAHSLNHVAASVYQHADGTRDIEGLAAAASAELGVPCDRDVVQDALGRLAGVELLDERYTPEAPQIARRAALRRIGLAAAALPMITTLVAPPPLLARSGGGRGRGGGGGKAKGQGKGKGKALGKGKN